MICAVVDRSDSPFHHLPDRSIMAPPHLSLKTQNDVPIATYIQFSKCREGGAAVSTFSHLRSVGVYTRTLRMTETCPAEKSPSISKDNFKAELRGGFSFFFKIFFQPFDSSLNAFFNCGNRASFILGNLRQTHAEKVMCMYPLLLLFR